MQRLGKLRGGEPSNKNRGGFGYCNTRHCYCKCEKQQKKNSTKGRKSNKSFKKESQRGSTIKKQLAQDIKAYL